MAAIRSDSLGRAKPRRSAWGDGAYVVQWRCSSCRPTPERRARFAVSCSSAPSGSQALHAAGLIDEYRLLVFPVTVGTGKRLFTGDAPPRGYTLLESRTTRAGAVYQVLTPKAFEAGGLTVQDGREAVR